MLTDVIQEKISTLPSLPESPRAIIFDFDGVILESAEIKTEAFLELFRPWPDHLPHMMEYHRKNTGISRYVKIRHFYEECRGQDCVEAELNAMADQYAGIVRTKVLAAPFVRGAPRILNTLKNFCPLFIASGTPQTELDEILAARELASYFCQVYGFPTGKKDAIVQICRFCQCRPEDVVFIGDGFSDLEAALTCGTPFILRETQENKTLAGGLPCVITDLNGLKNMFRSASRQNQK